MHVILSMVTEQRENVKVQVYDAKGGARPPCEGYPHAARCQRFDVVARTRAALSEATVLFKPAVIDRRNNSASESVEIRVNLWRRSFEPCTAHHLRPGRAASVGTPRSQTGDFAAPYVVSCRLLSSTPVARQCHRSPVTFFIQSVTLPSGSLSWRGSRGRSKLPARLRRAAG
jgi:hypothetical protein